MSEVRRQGHNPGLQCVNCYVERREGQVACTVTKFMDDCSLVLDSSTLVARFPDVFGTHLDVLVKIHTFLPTPLTRS